MTVSIPIFVRRDDPSQAQIEAGNYKKDSLQWRGLTISIENKAGTVRRGKNRNGQTWETRMPYDYGYFRGTMGVDGDHVDCYIGPHHDAPMVYVVHQQRYGDWERYDEDKVFVGFDSEESARAAFLAAYDDPRFLGGITAMPAEEFVTKVRATKENPQMIKSIVFVAKAFVAPHLRSTADGGSGTVRGYENKRRKLVIIADKPEIMQLQQDDGDSSVLVYSGTGFYVTLRRNGDGPVELLVGPFGTSESAAGSIDAARAAAVKVDPNVDFDWYHVGSITSESKLPRGVLNTVLGL